MPIDSSIALQTEVADPMKSIASMFNVANTAQGMRARKLEMVGKDQQNQSEGISLQERKNLQSALADTKSYTSDDGKVDFNKLFHIAMRVAPITGMDHVKNIYAAQTASAEGKSKLMSVSEQARGYLSRAAMAMQGQPIDSIHSSLDALSEQSPELKESLPWMKNGLASAFKAGGQKGVDGALQRMSRGVLSAPEQQTMDSDSISFVSTDKGTQAYNTKSGSNHPVGPVGAPMAPSNSFVTTPGGRLGIGNTANGQISEPQSASASQPPINFPVGESKETWDALQSQRTGAQQSALSAPVMHDINRTIVAEVKKGINTGTLGALTQKLASATGFQIAPGASTDYNLLGKMLERSALTAANSSGPQTNAGLDAAIRANGSLDYTPASLAKIAHLNDAATTNAELYHQGLEKTVTTHPDSIFAKRKFDTAWGKVATPQVLRLKNAVDSGNKEEVSDIIKEVGGKSSKGAHDLHQKLTSMMGMVQ